MKKNKKKKNENDDRIVLAGETKMKMKNGARGKCTENLREN